MNIVKLHDNRITLIHGDCLEALPRIKPTSIDCVITDYPYYKATKEDWDNAWCTVTDYLVWVYQTNDLVIKAMKDSASLYFWYQIGFKHQLLLDIASKLRKQLTLQDWITWQKSRGLGNRKGWLYTREECLWFTKTDDYYWNELAQYDHEKPTNRHDMGFNGLPRKSEYKRFTNIWQSNEDQNYGADRIRGHYTPKPLVLIERIVNAHTLGSNDVVLDPTAGSGTTAIACIKLDRRCIAIEKDQASFNLMYDRCQRAIGDYNHVE